MFLCADSDRGVLVLTAEAEVRQPSILISGGLAPGGVETHVSELCRILRRRGASVTIAAVASAWPADEIRSLRDDGVRILTTPFGWGRTAWLGKLQAFGTWPITLRSSFDTLYCHGHGRMHRWMHRFIRPGGACVYHELVDFLNGEALIDLDSSDYIIANSNPVATNWSRTHSQDRIRVLPFLTSRGPVPPPAPRPPVGKRVLKVAFLGRLVKHKQPEWLVEEWPTIAGVVPLAPARLDVYGNDPDSDILNRLRTSVRRRSLQDTITLHGEYRASDLARIMANTDLVVLPSEMEGLPLVLVEAMMHGVPFVAMSVGGISDLVNPDVSVVPVEKSSFVRGLQEMASRLRAGSVDARQLHTWADRKFGYDFVADQWHMALTNTRAYFEMAESCTAGGR